MGKPKMLGQQKPYIPNNRAGFHDRKRGRNSAERLKTAKDMKVPTKKGATP